MNQNFPSAFITARYRSRRGARSKAQWLRAGCARWFALQVSISESIGAMSIASSRWARRREVHAFCSASGGPTTGWTNRQRRYWCPAIASNIWRHRRLTTLSPKASAMVRSFAAADMMCLPSMSWGSPALGHSTRPNFSPKCSPHCPIRRSRPKPSPA